MHIDDSSSRKESALQSRSGVLGNCRTHSGRAVGKSETGPKRRSRVCGALLGAIYPGLKAARQDAIEALAYE